MGVKLLLRTQPQKGAAGPSHHELLKRLVDELCCAPVSARTEAWSVTCQLLKQGHGVLGAMGGPAAGPAAGAGGLCRDMWAVTFKEAPDQAYLLIRPDHKALECDAAVLRLLEKKLEYGKQMTVTLAGPTFSKGDFVLRLCTATQQIHSNQALLGHCLELEYLPVSSPAVAEGMVGEFVDLLRQTLTAAGGAGLELVRPSYDKYGMGGQPYGRLHAAVAYGEMVVTLLNASAAAQQPAAK